MGRVDILVNNAGTIRREDALAFTEKDWDEVIDLNLKSVFFLSQAVAKQFIAQGQGGKIINIASMPCASAMAMPCPSPVSHPVTMATFPERVKVSSIIRASEAEYCRSDAKNRRRL